MIDSVNTANYASQVRQRTIDSMNAINGNSGMAVNDNTDKKKKMSNKTKGALIGAGAGIVGGAVTGAATSKDKKKGAVVGGIIGGA